MIAACYIVATPIGNPRDITLRALDILSSVEIIVCEEYRRGTTLLKKINVIPKEIISLNEHNEQEIAPEIANRILNNHSVALISDHGTPGFEDPGQYLISLCIQMGIRVIPIPGPSSVMATLSIAGVKWGQFVYGGFLSREKTLRKKQLLHLKSLGLPIILLDTPYRLHEILTLVDEVFGKKQKVTLACDLTQRGEKIYQDEIGVILNQTNKKKAEFVLLIHDMRLPLNSKKSPR